jgi:hypothetical protein
MSCGFRQSPHARLDSVSVRIQQFERGAATLYPVMPRVDLLLHLPSPRDAKFRLGGHRLG